jgi:transcriptional regulator with XRE-family HTH domain
MKSKPDQILTFSGGGGGLVVSAELGPDVGARLKHAMEEAGLDAKELEKKTGYSKSQIYRYLNGENITLEAIGKFSKIFDKAPGWFFLPPGYEGAVADSARAIHALMDAARCGPSLCPKMRAALARTLTASRSELLKVVSDLVQNADDDKIEKVLQIVKILAANGD